MMTEWLENDYMTIECSRDFTEIESMENETDFMIIEC